LHQILSSALRAPISAWWTGHAALGERMATEKGEGGRECRRGEEVT